MSSSANNDNLQNANVSEILDNFVKACLVLNQDPSSSKQAEAWLLEFRKIPQVLELSKLLLERNIQNPIVQFQALLCIKDSLLRPNWTEIPIDQREQIRQFLFQFVSTNQLPSFVEKPICQIIAILYKRIWVQGTQQQQQQFRQLIFNELSQMLSDQSSQKQKHVLFTILSGLIDEFSYVKSTSLGMTWEFHHRSFLEFQQFELKAIFLLLKEKLLRLQSDPILFKECAQTLVQCLHWKFEETSDKENKKITFVANGAYTGTGNDSHVFFPGEDWRPLLVESDFLDLLAQLLSFSLTNKVPELVEIALNGIAQMSSFSGTIFGAINNNNNTNNSLQLTYLGKLLQLQFSLLDMRLNSYPGITPASLIQISEITSRTIENFRGLTLLSLGDATNGLLLKLTNFAADILTWLSVETDEEKRKQLEESFELALQSWVLIVSSVSDIPDEEDETDPNKKSQISSQLRIVNASIEYSKPLANLLLKKYVETRLAISMLDLITSDDREEPDHVQYEEQLSCVSYLGRLIPSISLPFLISTLEFGIKSIQTTTDVARSQSFEKMHWLLLITGFVLADAGDGEMPEVPEQFQNDVQQTGLLVAKILNLVFDVLKLENESIDKAKSIIGWSPLLASTSMWILKRFLKTYLPSRADPDNTFVSLFIGQKNEILVFVMSKVVLNLTIWQSENDPLTSTILLLLDASQNHTIATTIVQPAIWQPLMSVYAAPQSWLHFPTILQRYLIQSFLNVTDFVSEDAQQRLVYFQGVTVSLDKAIRACLENFESNPKSILLFTNLIERLRGCCRAVISDTNIVVDFCSLYFSSLIDLMPRFVGHPDVILTILKYFHDFLSIHAENLNDNQQLDKVFTSIAALFQMYSKIVKDLQNNRKSALGNKKKNYQEEDTYKDILLLLKISRVISNYAQESEQGASLMLFGLNIILPLLNSELIRFPKLSRTFFSLLNSVFEQFPRKLTTLPRASFDSLINAIRFGIEHVDEEISRLSIEALASLLKFNVKTVKKTGKTAFLTQLQENPKLFEDLGTFLMKFVLFSDFSANLNEYVSDAFFSFILSDQQQYLKLVAILISQQQNQTYQQRLNNAFSTLTSGNLQGKNERKNLEQFRKNFDVFLNDVKAFLLTK